MAVIFINPQTGEVQYRHDRSDERRNPLPPGTLANQTTRFDKATNADLFKDIQLLAPTGRYTVVAGQLRKDGNAITPSAPSEAYKDREAVEQLDDDFDALGGILSLLQVQSILKRVIRSVRFILRHLKEK